MNYGVFSWRDQLEVSNEKKEVTKIINSGLNKKKIKQLTCS